MRGQNATGPATAATVGRPLDVMPSGRDIPPDSSSTTTTQCEFGPVGGAELAAHLVALRYGLTATVAALVVELSGMGERS
jgi:hypothetical protein